MDIPEKEAVLIELATAQKSLEWAKTMLFLNTKAKNAAKRVVKRGQVYQCKLGFGVGSEENKERPCVILQYDGANATSPNTIVAPITHSGAEVPVVVPIADKKDNTGNIVLDGHVLLGNIVCVSKARLGDYKATLTPSEMQKVDEAIGKSLDIKRHYDKLQNILKDKDDHIEKLNNKIAKQNEKIVILEQVKTILGVEDIAELPKKIEDMLK